MSSLRLNEYNRPATLDEAMALLRRKSPRTKVLAGGTWLNGQPHGLIEAAVDIGGLGLDKIEKARNGALLRIGAAVSLQNVVEAMTDIPGLSVLTTTAHAMAGLNIRNQATVGGSIVTADSPSPLVTALLACNAELVIQATQERTVSLSGFLSYRQNILDGGALITTIVLPIPSTDTCSAYERVARTPRDYPIVCAVASCAIKDGIAGNMRVAVGGVANTPIRLTQLELALEKKPVASLLEMSLGEAVGLLTPPDNWLGSSAYRKEMAAILVRRAIHVAARITGE